MCAATPNSKNAQPAIGGMKLAREPLPVGQQNRVLQVADDGVACLPRDMIYTLPLRSLRGHFHFPSALPGGLLDGGPPCGTKVCTFSRRKRIAILGETDEWDGLIDRCGPTRA